MTEPNRIDLDANGIHFSALSMGQGPLMLCLHGFPDDAHTWRHQMSFFADAGYRVVAPFMRGYAPTSPSPTGTYQTAALGRDVVALLEALSPNEKAVVVGHDWGAIAAYPAALFAPERIEKLVTLAVPYGMRFQMAFSSSYAQQKRSWYIFFFQTFMADMAVPQDGLRFIRNLWHDWSPEWEFTEADIAPTLETLGRPGVLDAAIGYYRCLFNPALQDPALAADQMRINVEPITVPTLYIHGRSDGCMGVEMLDGMEDSFPNGLTKTIVDGAGHFVQCEKPDAVNRLILRFLRE